MSEKFETKTAKLHAWRQILVDRFPQCFAPSGSDVEKRPLAIGIDKELFARCPDLPRVSIRKALRHYASRPSYLRAVILGAARIGLDGQPAGLITEQEAEYALASLSAQREHNSRQKAIEAARRPKAVPAPSKELAIEPEPLVEPRRPMLSLPPRHEARRPVVVVRRSRGYLEKSEALVPGTGISRLRTVPRIKVSGNLIHSRPER